VREPRFQLAENGPYIPLSQLPIDDLRAVVCGEFTNWELTDAQPGWYMPSITSGIALRYLMEIPRLAG